jgi:hypothetical protein
VLKLRQIQPGFISKSCNAAIAQLSPQATGGHTTPAALPLDASASKTLYFPFLAGPVSRCFVWVAPYSL